MRIFQRNEIAPVLECKSKIIEAVKQGFISHAKGEIENPEPVQMLFGVDENSIEGDCHIKTASSKSLPYFCVKLATGFYKNPALGLSVNNGLVLLMSSQTGEPLALFQDDGHLTSARTAAAGALAASLTCSKKPRSLGVIGTGHQAELQARWIASYCELTDIVIWGRSVDKANALKARLADLGLEVETAASVTELCQGAKLIVTTTPSISPLIMAPDVSPGHHIIAMGSDSPGKVELDPAILGRADVILTDEHFQCLHHGELGHAVTAGLIGETKDQSFGLALKNPESLQLDSETISVVDLTGLGAQDLAIASFVYDTLITT